MFGRTIYVSNHAASFMDPLVVASFRPPIVFFLTRSDVFTKLTKPFLWAAHMLPIYRQQDGVDTKDENIKTFDECTKILKYGRNLLIFGEGFTDDVFIRRLKPVKKGAVRIGFYSLEKLNWKKKIYIAAVGCNYSDPNEMRSDLLISTSKRICLNDYRQEYEENPIKVINELTREIELLMREQITHVEDIDNLNFHENIMKLTRKGMNAKHSNTSIPLVKRWHYSQKLANWLNDRAENQLTELRSLKEELHDYFNLLGKLNVNENYLHELSLNHRINRIKELILLIVLSPTALLGLFHCGLPYLFVKRYVERSFKRKVFWGSVKLLLGMISMGILNIPFIFVIRYFIYPNYWVAFGYYALIGLFGLSAYMWWRNFIRYREKGIIRHTDLSKIIDKRGELIEKIYQQIPVA
ncbi:MAG: 1-acyl-sn-glycerol-3-phosphate acyltransferase [Flavobacteriales bacterium]